MVEINQYAPTPLKFQGKGDRVYLILESGELSAVVENYEEVLKPLQGYASSGANNEVNFRVQSLNNLSEIGNLIKTHSLLAFSDSLQVNFSFEKSPLISNFLVTVFENILGLPQFSGVIQSFRQLNL